MNRLVIYIVLFFIQLSVLNHLDFSALLYPQVFIMLLVNLPPYINRSYQILIAFTIGLLMDLFVATPGLHASACTALALFRIFLLARYDIEEIVANHAWLDAEVFGARRYAVHLFLCVLFYHLLAFGLESLGALTSAHYMFTVVWSAAVSYILILAIQLFIPQGKGV